MGTICKRGCLMQLRVETDAPSDVGAQIGGLADDAADVVGIAARALSGAAAASGDAGVEGAADELRSAATSAYQMASVLLHALGTVAVAGASDYAHVERQISQAASGR